MRSPLPRRAFLLTAAALAAPLGCSLRQPALQPRTFLISAPTGSPPAAEASVAPTGVLLIRPVRVATAFDTRALVIRQGADEYASDPYHSFLLSPGPMLTDALAGWVRTLGVFGQVTTGGSQLPPSHALEADITELYGDYREAGRPRAVIGGRFRLLHPLGSPAQVRWERTLQQEAPLDRAGAEALVAGWNRAWAALCTELAASFRAPPPADAGPRA